MHRWSIHKYELKTGSHDNIHLQNAWNKHGKDNFLFEIIEQCLPENLLLTEQKYLDACKQCPSLYYNLVYDSGGFIDRSGKNNGFYGKHHTKKTKKIISKIHKGKILTKEQKQKISINHSKWNKGKHLSKEIKKKISLKHKGKIISQIQKDKISKTMIEKQYFRDMNIYKFKNRLTGDIFEGNRHDFIKKYNLARYNVSRLINKIRPSHKNWILI
jgi:group I intron endonuclease